MSSKTADPIGVVAGPIESVELAEISDDVFDSASAATYEVVVFFSRRFVSICQPMTARSATVEMTAVINMGENPALPLLM
jgi:hypothetical protein